MENTALGGMISAIPVIVMGGVVMKFAEWIPQPKTRPKKKHTKRQNLSGIGNFRNVGY